MSILKNLKKCITCHRTKEYKNKSSKDFICQSCRCKNMREKNIDASRENERIRKRKSHNRLKQIKKPISIRLKEDIITFVYTINKQNGFATTKQIFVDMITLYNDLPKGNLESIQLDTLSVGQQLKYMWNRLKMVSSNTL
jgi:uncharacterized protein (DUF4415 family)